MKSFFCTIFLVLIVVASWSQVKTDTLTIRLQNQYENPVANATIKLLPQGTTATTNESGAVTIDLAGVDSIAVNDALHEAASFLTSNVRTNATLTVNKVFTWKDLVNPMYYIVNGGLFLLLFIVFAETGLFAGFFLPGDSLLFVAGIYSGNLGVEFFKTIGLAGMEGEWINLIVIVALITFAGVVGNSVGYWFGRKSGPYLFQRKDSFFYKKKYLYQAKEFYEKHGGGAIIFARFLPIVRTFAPIIAGIVQMDRKKFMFYNIVGCVAWVVSMIFAGHFLYKFILSQFDLDLRKHLEIIVLAIVLVTTAPVAYKIIFGKTKEHHT
jgi:membrane-associated protein